MASQTPFQFGSQYWDDLEQPVAAQKNQYLDTGMLSTLAGRNMASAMPAQQRILSGMMDATNVQNLQNQMQTVAADRAAKMKSAQLNTARESGMAPAEISQLGMQADLTGAGMMNEADIQAQNLAAQRRQEASGMISQMLNPVQQFGGLQIESGENLAGRMTDVLENAANRSLVMGSTESAQRYQGMRDLLNSGIPGVEGAVAQMLFGGEGGNIEAIAPGIESWITAQGENEAAINSLYGDMGGYLRSLMGGGNGAVLPVSSGSGGAGASGPGMEPSGAPSGAGPAIDPYTGQQLEPTTPEQQDDYMRNRQMDDWGNWETPTQYRDRIANAPAPIERPPPSPSLSTLMPLTQGMQSVTDTSMTTEIPDDLKTGISWNDSSIPGGWDDTTKKFVYNQYLTSGSTDSFKKWAYGKGYINVLASQVGSL